MDSPASEPFYIVYIDEAGDSGLATVRPRDPNGASEWLTIGAVVVKASLEPKTVEWVRAIRSDIKQTQGPELHFRKLSDHRKTRVAEMVAELPVKGFVFLSHKPNMRGHKNPAAEAVSLSPTPRGWFYNWCIRILLERVSHACLRGAQNRFGEPRYIKLVFARRGGVSYRWFGVYLQVLIDQAVRGTTVLTKRVVAHQVLDRRLIEDIPAHQSAGCQLADVVTSAFHVAADANGPRWCTSPAERLFGCMADENGFHEDWGVTLHPTPARRAAAGLTANQRRIFDFYRFNFT